ncbi:MAG: PEGA domain-containing protein [Acidobacteria bacterium]|nr:PEGA domain-containing protein [Acidobacteriota bacterium]
MNFARFRKMLEFPRNFVWTALALGTVVFLAGATIGVFILRAPKLVAINLATDPGGAEAFLDGQSIGFTPLTTAVPEGEHTVALAKPGYQAIERKIYADRSAPKTFNDFSFGLDPNIANGITYEKSEVVAKLKLQAQEAYRRGDLVAPENDNALFYIGQLSLISPDDPMIAEMRERIRQALKQRAEATRAQNDLG